MASTDPLHVYSNLVLFSNYPFQEAKEKERTRQLKKILPSFG